MSSGSEFRRSRPQSHELSRAAIDASPDVIYLLDERLLITYCNPAWDRFALANAGESVLREHVVGTPLMTHISEPLHLFYHEVLSWAAASGRMFDFDYECSSADLYRMHHMIVMPLRDGGVALVNSTKVERLHGADAAALLPSGTYASTTALITMCSHCRRTRRGDGSNQWDWVSDYLRLPSLSVSYGLCPLCTEYFYGRDMRALMPTG